jgi:multicomponent Na+:H+ antiporter subunit G
MTFVAYTLVAAGLFFMVVSAIGLMQLPGLYTRAHAVAKSETLGLLLVLVGLLFHPDHTPGSSTRLVFVLVFSMIANPTAVHALLRAARRAGVQPWRLPDAEQEERG